ncbi:MAG: TetR/AcrR family transcriptional regulator [Polyangiales bacterium]
MTDSHPDSTPKGPEVGGGPARKAEPRRSQEQRRDASTRGLLSAALSLIAERGFRGTSFAMIAQRAGYSPSMVSHRFGSKEGLLFELVKRMVTRWGADVVDTEVEERTGVAALSTIAAAHRRALEQYPDRVRALYVLLFESLIEAPDLKREFAGLDQRFREGQQALLAAAGTTAGEGVDLEAQSVLFLAMLRGITLQWLVDPDALDLPRVYAALDQLLERGLRS